MNYRTEAGRRIDCLAYLEFRDVTPLQRRQLDAMSTNGDWSGYGQRIYERLPATNRQAQDGIELMFADRVDVNLYARALKAAPGVAFRTTDGRAARRLHPPGRRRHRAASRIGHRSLTEAER